MKKIISTVLLLFGCSPGGDKAKGIETADRGKLISIPNAAIFEGMLVGGRPDPKHLKQAKSAGYTTIINLQANGEAGVEKEIGLAQTLGLTYVSIPVAGAKGMTKENVVALDQAIHSAKGSIVLHCASGNRVGGLIALRAKWLKGKTSPESLREGISAGLTSLQPVVSNLLESSE